MVEPIYLDYNATTPIDPEVVAAMRPFWETEFGNPSSSHWYGIAPKQAVENARKQVAALLNCNPREVIFTSGGTESNNYAIAGMAGALRQKGNHIITTAVEHPAILEACNHLQDGGFEITVIPVDAAGRVEAGEVEKAIRPQTILITVMHANNEVGTIQPIEEISQVAHDHGIVVHTDAAQSVGKIPTEVNALGVDMLSVAGHKIYAPKGVGALFIGHLCNPEKFLHGAGQEMGRRAGTENVLGIVGLGMACEIAKRDLKQNADHMKQVRDQLHHGLSLELGDRIRFNGHPDFRLPNTLNLSFAGLEANRLLEEIGLEAAASAGAACHSDKIEISHVLSAMRVPREWAKGTLRFSTGKMTTPAEIEKATAVIVRAVNSLKASA